MIAYVKRKSRMHNHYVPTIIVDRNALFRVGLMHTLAETRFRVTAEYSTFSEIVADEIPRTTWLLLVGFDELIRQFFDSFCDFKKKHDNFHVVFLGEHADEQEIRTTMDFFGECYVLKNAISPNLLLQSLELVMAGQSVFTHDFMRILRSEWSSRAAAAPPLRELPLNTAWQVQRLISPSADLPSAYRLSERETAILMRLMHGASNKVIARELDIAEATVKVHVKSVLRKIRVKNRTQAATWAWSRCSHQETALAARSGDAELTDGILVGLSLPADGAVANGNLRTEPAQIAAPVRTPAGLAGG
jgi:two-component system, NarL family, nitrate/nitrite response regulator NarL